MSEQSEQSEQSEMRWMSAMSEVRGTNMRAASKRTGGMKRNGKLSTKRRGRNARSGARQGELAFRSWGGARKGAGRKPKGDRALVSHDTRPVHKARFPVLVTTRVRPGLSSLRRAGEAARIRAALAVVNGQARAQTRLGSHARIPQHPPRGAPFQVVHHSIQSNHLHLIVEAEDRGAMTAGMRGLLVRIARALNRLWGRSGAVFADRFHERELHNPLQVRNALVYVLQNLRKHGICVDGPDPLSSGPEFDGWHPARAAMATPGSRARTFGGGGALPAPITLPRAERVALPSPSTWLLQVGWRRHGLIDPGERPRSR
jgi:hypothetical protein